MLTALDPTAPTLQELWEIQEPYCGSCGWLPCFYEVEFEKEGPGIWAAKCVSKVDEDRSDHRGHKLYAAWEMNRDAQEC